jgi:hypothetical protein
VNLTEVGEIDEHRARRRSCSRWDRLSAACAAYGDSTGSGGITAGLPVLGSGLGYRTELADAIAQHANRIDSVEVMAEHFLFAAADRRELLRELTGRFPIVPHGVELSIGSDDEVDDGYVEALTDLVTGIEAPWFSDHLCFTGTDRIALGMLTPCRVYGNWRGEFGARLSRCKRR